MAAFPRFDVADIRGNVDTRLQKLADARWTRWCWPRPVWRGWD